MLIYKMKPLILLAIISALLLSVLCERIKLVTQNDNYNFFPLKSHYLELNVKAEENVRIALTNSSKIELPNYEIVLGGAGDTESYIKRDNHRVRERKGSVLAKGEYRKFWISLDRSRGILKVGSNYNKPLLYYSDPESVPVSYFGVTTNGKNPGHWDFGSDLLLTCTKDTSIEKIVYEKCIKLGEHVYVPGEVITPDVV